MFLSFIKLFSLYSLTLFNRRRNLIFRLSMLHFRFEEDRDVSIRIIFRFVVERTKRIRKVSEPWIRFCKLIVARKSFSFLFPSFFFFFFLSDDLSRTTGTNNYDLYETKWNTAYRWDTIEEKMEKGGINIVPSIFRIVVIKEYTDCFLFFSFISYRKWIVCVCVCVLYIDFSFRLNIEEILGECARTTHKWVNAHIFPSSCQSRN